MSGWFTHHRKNEFFIRSEDYLLDLALLHVAIAATKQGRSV
jgi:hypothetical protein